MSFVSNSVDLQSVDLQYNKGYLSSKGILVCIALLRVPILAMCLVIEFIVIGGFPLFATTVLKIASTPILPAWITSFRCRSRRGYSVSTEGRTPQTKPFLFKVE